ncbi:MAG: hypothetical protein WD314_16010 [Trueperaceae bacterium]
MLLAAGVFAAVAMSRKTAGARDDLPLASRSALGNGRGHAPRRFKLSNDAPSLNLRRGELLRVEPEALIFVGDVVALKTDEPEVVLTRFHDELMHCVEGLVVREPAALPAS